MTTPQPKISAPQETRPTVAAAGLAVEKPGRPFTNPIVSSTEVDAALVSCLRTLARRGRAWRKDQALIAAPVEGGAQ